jgi:NAD(P)-dependent dehydrogenase (short-subunit alcohol dehydrogenase family)
MSRASCTTCIAFAVARHWPDVLSNALEPGWVATRMGGPGAPDDLDEGYRTQVWLAVSEDPAARVTRLSDRPRKAELMPVRIDDMKIPFAP